MIVARFALIQAWARWYDFPFDGTNVYALNRYRAARGLPPVAIGEFD